MQSPLRLAQQLFNTPREVHLEDPTLPLKHALAQADLVKGHLVEHLSNASAAALISQERATAQNNPLAIAFAAGELKALTDLLALTAGGKE
jgi:hypothetical protein